MLRARAATGVAVTTCARTISIVARLRRLALRCASAPNTKSKTALGRARSVPENQRYIKGVPKKAPSGAFRISCHAVLFASLLKPAVMLIKLANLVLLANLVGAVPLPAKFEELNTLDTTTDPAAISDADGYDR